MPTAIPYLHNQGAGRQKDTSVVGGEMGDDGKCTNNAKSVTKGQ